MDTSKVTMDLDALIVGAGFSGVYQLKRLREQGYTVKLVESGSGWGGVWYWNRYPGARCDSPIPFYEFSDPVIWKNWHWKQRFPDSAEIRRYFDFVADTWNLNEDAIFNTFVTAAKWEEESSKWKIETRDGYTFTAKYLLLNTGVAAKRHIPAWPGIDKFRGNLLHASHWPKEEPDLKGKKIAVIGTGATGIQLAQDLSKVAGEFFLFQRTPNTAIPMGQADYDVGTRPLPQKSYPEMFADRTQSFSGFSFNFHSRATFEDDAEQRKRTYEELWAKGDFSFWLANYHDMLFTEEANREAYEFWKSKVRARIANSELHEVMAPEIQQHGFGCKRISLENGFYEIFEQPNVNLVNLKKTPIVEITENGIKTTDGEHKLDYIICATGYDSVTGSLRQIDITGLQGQKLNDKWDNGTKTYLGLAVSGFPNLFFAYGPQAPSVLCNGPTCAELQGDWIVEMMNAMKSAGKTTIEAQVAVEEQWVKDIWQFANATLIPKTDSWFVGSNIVGKPREPLMYLGGVPKYYKTITEVAESGYTGFSRA